MRAFQKNYCMSVILMCAVLVIAMPLASMAEEKKAQDDIWADQVGTRGGERRGIRRQPGRDGDRSPGGPMHEERMLQIFKQLEAKDPELAKKLGQLKKDSPEKFYEEFFKAARKYKLGMGPDGGHRGMGAQDGRGRDKGFGPRDGSGGGRGRDQDGRGRSRGPNAQGGRGGYRERMSDRAKKSNEDYIVWLKKNYPDEAAKLEKLQKSKPELLNRHIMMSKRRYGRIMEMQKKNPKLAKVMKEDLKLGRKRRELLRKIKKAKGGDRDKLVDELEDIVSARFDIIVKKKQLQYEALAKKIQQLNKQIDKQKAEADKLIDKKDQAISDRMKALLSEEQKIKWDD